MSTPSFTILFEDNFRGSMEKLLIESLTQFCLDTLLIKAKQPRKLIIAFSRSTDLFETEECVASVIDESDENDGSAREFLIEVDHLLRGEKLYSTIAHEMVHVIQALNGLTKDHSFRVTSWCGKKFNLLKTDYWELPWEIDAYGRERGLLMRWIEANDLDKKFTWAKKSIRGI